jgi:crotonobetainyl-CoA:carnitine CoA-transferase CaiB-like acyl-CoA transferase
MSAVPQALDGIRVLELATGIQGPYAGKLFADLGADVIKAEPPGGDPARRRGPFPDDAPDPEQSALFLHLNTNKRGIVVDPSTPAGRDRVLRLAATADLVIESESPGTLERWGLGFGALRAANPRIVLASITPFGQDGPYAHYKGEEIVYYAMGGPMSSTGLAEREPVKLGGDIISYQCGNLAAAAALAALTAVELHGDAIHVDCSNFESQQGSIVRRLAFLTGASYNGAVPRREGTQRLTPAPMGIYPCADGYVQIITIPTWVPRMLATLKDPTLDELYGKPTWLFDPEVPDATDAVLYPWLLERTRAEAMAEAEANQWPLTAVHTTADVVADEHFTARGFLVDADHPAAGRLRQPGAPFRMDDGWALRRPAPLLGEHDAEVDTELATPAERPVPVAAVGRARLPLEGVRVLDLSVVWAGPYCTMILGDLGAEVLRIDNPYLFPSSTKGFMPRVSREMVEALGPIVGAFPDADPGERPWNRHAMFNCHARNKRIATLDLRQDSGREAFLRLVEVSDVLVENNAARVLDKLGLGWDVLRARNPRFICVRMAPMGLSGPYRDHVGFGAHFEALSGLTAIRGYADADPTSTTSVFHMDPASGATGAFAVMAALRRRERTGTGTLIEFAQSENLVQHIGELLVDAARTGRDHPPPGNRHRTRAPQGCYRCAGDDAWAVLSVGDDEEWAGLRRAMGEPAWAADDRFATAAGRLQHHDELDDHLGAWTAALAPEEVFHRCQAEGVPAGPVLDELAALADPHLAARGFFRENVGVDTGAHRYPGHLWHWTGPPLAWGPIPAMGDDNEYVWREVAGLTDAEYEALAADGHLATCYFGPDGNPV